MSDSGIKVYLEDLPEEIMVEVMDTLAHKGLAILRGVLDDNGFNKLEHLKNYEIYADVQDDMVTYTVEVETSAINTRSRKVVDVDKYPGAKAKYQETTRKISDRGEARKYARRHILAGDGSIRRVQMMRSALRPARDARKHARDPRMTSERRARPDARKTAGTRLVEHEKEAIAPRRMEVNQEGQIEVSGRQVRNTSTKVIFPKEDYQGIIKVFLDRLMELIETVFEPLLQEYLMSELGE